MDNLSNSDEGNCRSWNSFCIDQNERERGIALANRILRDPCEAEDVVHDIYVKLLKRRDADRIADKPNYFLKSVTNRCRSLNARRSASMVANALSLDIPTTEESEEASMQIPDPVCSPEMNAEYTEENKRLLRIVQSRSKKLTNREKALFLSRLKGYSNEEIADAWCEEVKKIRREMNAVVAKMRHRLSRGNEVEDSQ